MLRLEWLRCSRHRTTLPTPQRRSKTILAVDATLLVQDGVARVDGTVARVDVTTEPPGPAPAPIVAARQVPPALHAHL